MRPGCPTRRGLLLSESFYWDLNDRPRAFLERVRPKTPRNCPNAVRAGCYAGTLHYLRSVAALGVAQARDGAAVVAHVKAMVADDDAFGRTVIRADGWAMVTPTPFRVKAPAASRGEWEFYEVVASTSST